MVLYINNKFVQECVYVQYLLYTKCAHLVKTKKTRITIVADIWIIIIIL